MAEKCLFDWKFNCESYTERLIESGDKRIQTIIKCSKVYNDDFYNELEEKIAVTRELTVKCHKSCVSTYCSATQLERHRKRKHQEEVSLRSPKKTRKKVNTFFSFKEHCIFCAEECKVLKDEKNPSRWRPAYMCKEADVSGLKKSFKDSILEVCEIRKDEWAHSVRIRVLGSLSDLHAADARYHVNCRSNFMSPKSIKSATRAESSEGANYVALEFVINEVTNNKSTMWTSVELYQMYQQNGGTELSRKHLIKAVSEKCGSDLVVLSSPGVANIVIFKSTARQVLKFVDSEEDDIENAISVVSKTITTEILSLPKESTNYRSTINIDIASEQVSNTLMKLLCSVSEKLNNSLPAMLIGSIVTSTKKNFPTNLQIALGIVLRDTKSVIQLMHKFGITCSYDEVLRFKKSAATAVVEDAKASGLFDVADGMIQVVADNFDAEISSQNGKRTTHSLAVLLAQEESVESYSKNSTETFKRISKTDMANHIKYDVQIHHFNGPKKPNMPQKEAQISVLPLKLLCQQTIASIRAGDMDFEFMKEVTSNPECPEFNGYNTSLCRKQGHKVKNRTRRVYLPLIDMIPSHPDTIFTALNRCQELVHQTGQKYVVCTFDLQLYRVAVHIKWALPEHFQNVILRLGGMHTLMSFCGSIGTLMEGSGLVEILSDVFAGVPKMMLGKKFPQNVRALRLLAEEILRHTVIENNITSKKQLFNVLSDLASKSRTSKLWIDIIIKPVFIMMKFVRAEREGEWMLHLEALREMLPYFFSAGHVHYARYATYYYRSMIVLPAEVRQYFMEGQHVMRHNPGVWNGIWSDMYIETTFMKYGHGKGGIIGITLKPETLKTWALSLHISCQLENALFDMAEDTKDVIQILHKEEGKSRVLSDKMDREGIRQKLELCINPLNAAHHADGLLNIVSGKVARAEVNVDYSLEIGLAQMKDFEKGFPENFHKSIAKKVVSMADKNKCVVKNSKGIPDPNVIYSRIIGIQASSREIDISKTLDHELSHVPTSMFTEEGEMRSAKAKSMLKKMLQVSVSPRTIPKRDIIIIDGMALLWTVHWPNQGTVTTLISNLKHLLKLKLERSEVYLIFDRYYDYSTKSATRGTRSSSASRVYKIAEHTPLPPQKVVLTVTENKKQLITLICEDLCTDKSFHKDVRNNLVITGLDNTPYQISRDSVIKNREDLYTTHEEADTIIIQQMIAVSRENPEVITIVSDDTDVFVLLLHYYQEYNISTCVLMESPVQERTVVDIGETVKKHSSIISELLAAHALSGCDTVACYFGIGKGKIVKVLRSGLSLSLLGDERAEMNDVIEQATSFISACYGQHGCKQMSETRVKVWASKASTGSVTAPNLRILPPTTAAFLENVKRAHFQASIWRSVTKPELTTLDPVEYGWSKDEANKSLVPVAVPEGIAYAPEYILKLVKCGCTKLTPCKSSKCSCYSSRLTCTLFCACSDLECNNTS